MQHDFSKTIKMCICDFFSHIYKNLHFYPQALTQRLGRIINGHIDLDNRGVIFTEAFVARHKARIRGLFSAITR